VEIALIEVPAPAPREGMAKTHQAIAPSTPPAQIASRLEPETEADAAPRGQADRAQSRPQGPVVPSKEGSASGTWLGMRKESGDLVAPACATCPPESVRQYYGNAPGKEVDPFKELPEVHGKSRWHARKGGRYQRYDETFVTTIERDGSIRFDDKPNVQVHPEMLGGTFDLTDAAMKAAGMEIYPYRKLALMESTRAQREIMAARERSDSLRHSIATMRRRLAELWRRPELSSVHKRKLLFLLWDECAEDGSEEVVGAGEAVRAQILGFIRDNLPADSEQAYSEDELNRLNEQRNSKQPFLPYQRPL
jgi:hypothetical protein